MLRRASLSVVASFLLLGCGGGGSDSNDTVENASVNAGSDLSIEEKSDFTLSALGSPSGGTFTWQVIDGPNMEGFPQEGQELKLTAPDVKADTSATLKVEYLAPNGVLVSDTVTIAIGSRNQLPIPLIEKTAPDKDVLQYKDEITLSAEASTDPDENGKIIEYLWEQISGPALTFERNDQATLQFVHPLLSSNETARFKLTLTDDEGGQSSTEFSLTLYKNAQVVFADAGEDINVIEFDKGELNASGSLSSSGAYTCLWTQIERSPTQLDDLITDPNLCQTTFTAPDVDVASVLKFQVTVSEPGGFTDKDTMQVKVQRRAVGENLNDTGQQRCFNGEAVITCENTTFPRQDAELGRDSFVLNEGKTGSGLAAFDFTKLDENARAILDASASDFSCVKDNNTGLIWEVKLANTAIPPNAPLRDTRNTYTWFLTNYPNGKRGTDLSTCSSNAYCDAQQYINEVNATNYCGGRNWRLPTFTELMGIFNYGEVAGSSYVLDPNFFPAIANSNWTGTSYYWTSQASIEGATGSSDLIEAYAFDMLTGQTVELVQETKAYIRLVREVSNNGN
ncbi:PKD domain-containing protein [Pseudoalteromonas phenolica]|uniref:Lcl C-terminal domain-containing protein n=1 Tax=Pseudoalteromonas phenolica TaxID=161398 RepID=UPI00384E04C3|tara:strand:+ start:360 stop:2057 length:1698 start_codon:yes stop_codon:yes gene_type:complete